MPFSILAPRWPTKGAWMTPSRRFPKRFESARASPRRPRVSIVHPIPASARRVLENAVIILDDQVLGRVQQQYAVLTGEFSGIRDAASVPTARPDRRFLFGHNNLMRRARHLWILPFASLLLSLEGQPPRTSPQPNSYVDARLCATCHSEIAKTYAPTGMARSFYSLPPTFTGGNPYHHEKSGTWYATVKRDDGYYQRRWRIGNAGQEILVQELRIDYVMGSGNHVRTYLHRTQRGALIELPLAWYPENGGTWAMNPGYDRDYTLPARTISYECMFCHNAYPNIPSGNDGPGSEPLFAGELPQGIDCQRCHGPGGNHVRAAQTGGDTRATIVNPARLSPDRQLEVCMQCHLETTSLELPHSIVKYDRGPFSFRPGEPLGDFMIAFDHAPGGKHENDFEIAHSAYRLRKSQCFLRSTGKLTCTTCHNPHDIPRGEAATLHYNSVCGSCHQIKHTADPNCIGCHMPKRRTQDVVHAVMTDHLIQRRPPSGDPLAQLSERQEFDENGYRG
jgi:hypothetical protein